jgi:hypothetical protein
MPPDPTAATIAVNRAPVPTLWAAIVAQRLGFPWIPLTLGRAVCGSSARTKARRLGVIEERQLDKEKRQNELRPGMRRSVFSAARSRSWRPLTAACIEPQLSRRVSDQFA